MIEYNKEQYENSASNDLIDVVCSQCHEIYKKKRVSVYRALWDNQNNIFCSKKCMIDFRCKAVTVSCGNCGKSVTRVFADYKNSKSGHAFCNHSCSATYTNTHKTYGVRRSKMETFIESKIREHYPDLEMICNDKTAIESELDFYFPTLKFAIELNGIFHYEPIYGDDKLDKIQNNDSRKMIACYKKGIELAVVDTSSVSHMSKKNKTKYWGIIKDILETVIKSRQ